MMLHELGIQYIKTAEQLRNRAKSLHTAGADEAREICARITELRAIAAMLAKYGRYLCHYYNTEGSNHAK